MEKGFLGHLLLMRTEKPLFLDNSPVSVRCGLR